MERFLVSLLAALCLLPVAVAEAATPTFDCSRLPAGTSADAACRIVSARNGLAAEVPPAGTSVAASSDGPNGAADLTVSTGPDGVVTASAEPSTTGADVSAYSPAPCSDDAYTWDNYKVRDRLYYYYNAFGGTGFSPEPSYLSDVNVSVENGLKNMVFGANDCGYGGAGFQTYYTANGRTSKGANITADPRCSGDDGQNTVSWGPLNSGDLAVTCRWYKNGYDNTLGHGDIRVNPNFSWYNVGRPYGCSWSFDVDSVMTHEWGHVEGLGHVDETYHGYQTMSTQLAPCDESPRTLGRGDWLGMYYRYGLR